MKRTLVPLELSTSKVRMKQNNSLENFEDDLVKVCEYTISLDKKLRKKDFEKAKKIVYLDFAEYDKEEGILYLRFKSARYSKRREVIDTNTLKSRGVLKREKDGDEEKTHAVIKFDWLSDEGVCIFERNSDGTGVSQVFEYLNDRIIKYHEKIKDNVYYCITHANIVSKDFLTELDNVKRIKGVTLTVNQEDLSVSETKAFAGRDDLSEDVDLYFRPTSRGKSIAGNTVKEFYKLYNAKNRKIKRITVKADDKSESAIVFDTEKIKEKEIVEIEETLTGEAKEESIKNKLIEVAKKY